MAQETLPAASVALTDFVDRYRLLRTNRESEYQLIEVRDRVSQGQSSALSRALAEQTHLGHHYPQPVGRELSPLRKRKVKERAAQYEARSRGYYWT